MHCQLDPSRPTTTALTRRRRLTPTGLPIHLSSPLLYSSLPAANKPINTGVRCVTYLRTADTELIDKWSAAASSWENNHKHTAGRRQRLMLLRLGATITFSSRPSSHPTIGKRPMMTILTEPPGEIWQVQQHACYSYLTASNDNYRYNKHGPLRLGQSKLI